MPIAHVFDTYATTQRGKILHFDVVLAEQNPELAVQYATQWLESIGEANASASLKTCVFCHSAEPPTGLAAAIAEQGYGIIPMEGCPR